MGTSPTLPAPEKSLIPLVNVVDARGWREDQKPKPAAGLQVNAFAAGIDRVEWARLNNDPLKPLTNRALQGRFPPGSVFKMIVGLVMLLPYGALMNVLRPMQPARAN